MARWFYFFLVAVAGGLLFSAASAPAVAQVKIRIRSGPIRPGSSESGAPDGGAPKVVAVEPTPEQASQISRLIEQLGAPTLRERDRAMSELAGFGASAITLVEGALEHDDDEIGHRCVILLEVLNSGQAELFLAARKLGMSITELQTKLSAQDPSDLLALLEQNSGAGMAPVWARVIASLSPQLQRFPAALACRRAEGPEGYGSVLARAAREKDTRNNTSRVDGMTTLVSLIPPNTADHAAMVLAALPGISDPLQQAMAIDGAMDAACGLRGCYEAASCLSVWANPENNRLLAALDEPRPAAGNPRERLLLAVVLALTPQATEGQLNAAMLPPLAAMTPRELEEYCALCARSNLGFVLEKALTTALAMSFDDRRLMSVASGLGQLEDPSLAMQAIDLLPAVGQFALLNAWWLSPPDPEVIQPFLISRVVGKSPTLRSACARLLGGYRAASTAQALGQSALAFADTSPGVLSQLAPMADLLPSEVLKQLAARLDKADGATCGPLIEVMVSSGDVACGAQLKERWKRRLPRNELWAAVNLLARDEKSASGAFCRGRLFMARIRNALSRPAMMASFSQTDLIMLRRLLACDEAEGFALLAGLAADPFALGSADAILSLALAGKDGPIVPELVKLHAAGNDPRGNGITLALSVSQSPQGDEFRSQTLKRGMDGPDVWALLVAVGAGLGGKITHDEMLAALATTPQDIVKFRQHFEQLMRGPLPAGVVKALATAALFDQESSNLLDVPAVVLLLRYSSLDMLDLLYGAQKEPVPRTSLQIFVTAAMGDATKAKEILGRLEPSKDGSNFATREFARAWLGMTSGPVANAALHMAWRGQHTQALLRARAADEGNISALRALFDGFGGNTVSGGQSGFAGVILGSSRGGDGLAAFGAGDAALWADAGQFIQMAWAPMCERWLGEKVTGDFAQWWSSRRGLVQFDQSAKRFKLAALK